MKISVLLPTRNRVKMVKKTINSLYDNVSNTDVLEVLLGVDKDDPSLESLNKMINESFKNFDIKICISEKRHGYFNLHKYINMLSEKSTGDWLFLWNDDSYVLTENWDKLVSEYKDTFVLLSPKVKENPNYPGTMFPIIPKVWFNELGHYSLNCHNDTWVEEIAKELNIFQYIPMWVSHLRDKYRAGVLTDQTWEERRQDKKGFVSNDMVKFRNDDVIKLREYINTNYE